MTELEEALRRTLPERAEHQFAPHPTRDTDVRRRVVRHRRRQRLVASVAAVTAIAGSAVVITGHGFNRAGDDVSPSGTGVDYVNAILEGAPLPPSFDKAALAPLAGKDRVTTVEGAAQAVTCAWVSRWSGLTLEIAADRALEAAVTAPGAGKSADTSQDSETGPPASPTAGAPSPKQMQADEARAILVDSDDWVMLQAIAADSEYPAQVALAAAQINMNKLDKNWVTDLHCDRFPGNTNLYNERP